MIQKDGTLKHEHQAANVSLVLRSIGLVNEARGTDAIKHEGYNQLMDIQDVTLVFKDAEARQAYTVEYARLWREGQNASTDSKG